MEYGSDKAAIKISIVSNIYGFLIVSPMTFKASVEFSLILAWVSLKQADNFGTILGRQACNCLGAQLAMLPSAQMYVILFLQFYYFSKPPSKNGRSFLTPKALNLFMMLWATFLDVSLTVSLASLIRWIMILISYTIRGYNTRPKLSSKALSINNLPFFYCGVLQLSTF